MEHEEEFPEVFLNQKETLNVTKAEQEVVTVAQRMVRENPEIGGIVFECTNMPPFRNAVKNAVNLPVFDIVTFTYYVFDVIRK